MHPICIHENPEYAAESVFQIPNKQSWTKTAGCFSLLFCLWGTCGFQQWWDCSGCSIYLAAISVKSDLKSFQLSVISPRNVSLLGHVLPTFPHWSILPPQTLPSPLSLKPGLKFLLHTLDNHFGCRPRIHIHKSHAFMAIWIDENEGTRVEASREKNGLEWNRLEENKK